jgi:hypothetical protein
MRPAQTATTRLLFWAPRILCFAFAAFLAIFALDVFDMHLGPARTALALLMHMIPSLIVLAILFLVWNREWIGAILFPLLAVIHYVSKRGELDPVGYAAIEVPLLVLAFLFWMSWRTRGARKVAG